MRKLNSEHDLDERVMTNELESGDVATEFRAEEILKQAEILQKWDYFKKTGS